MAGAMEGLSTINSFIRTVIALVVIGGVSAAGYFGYTTYNAKDFEARAKAKELADAQGKLAQVEGDLAAAAEQIEQKDARIQEQGVQIDELNVRLDKLETSLRLLKVEHRVAKFTAVDQTTDEATGEISTLIEFVELNDEGAPIDTPRQFRIRGDTVYIDAWVVKFQDKYVEAEDLERGTSIMLFKRIFGSGQKPEDGYPLDEVGSAPKAYARGGQMSDFEKKIWGDFWNIANDLEQMQDLGIVSADGKAANMKVVKGRSYQMTIRSIGDPTIRPEEPMPPADAN